jgi:CBS domain-containing protein
MLGNSNARTGMVCLPKEVHMKVSEEMDRDVATVSPDANLVEAASVMRTRNNGFLAKDRNVA